MLPVKSRKTVVNELICLVPKRLLIIDSGFMGSTEYKKELIRTRTTLQRRGMLQFMPWFVWGWDIKELGKLERDTER